MGKIARQRAFLRRAIEDSYDALDRQHERVRSFRNIILLLALCIAVLVLITIGVPRDALASYYDSLQVATRITHPWAVAEERELTVFLARRPRTTLQEVWPTLAGRN